MTRVSPAEIKRVSSIILNLDILLVHGLMFKRKNYWR